MAYSYVIIDGQRVEVNIARQYKLMEADFRAATGEDLIISSGTRTRAEQAYLYDGWINRRPGFNLAAPPGQSNHEEYGPIGPIALDLRDSGSNAGVTVIGSARSNWLAANCGRFGFTNAGHFFSPREGWHYEGRGIKIGGSGALVTEAPSSVSVDGQLGPQTIALLQARVGAGVDGEMGPNTISKLQERLGVGVDGQLGPQTISELQRRVGAGVDGDWGAETTRKLQEHLNAGGNLSKPNPGAPAGQPGQLDVDGQLGPATVKRLQQSVGVDQDGEWGPATTSALQKAVGARVDGELGPQTIKALQKNVGAAEDGQIGPDTVRKLQEFLNSGKPWVAVEVAPQPQPSDPGFVVSPRTPVYPGAAAGWSVPLGQGKRDAGAVVTTLFVHHETAFTSQVAYFKTANDRGSCPTWEVNGKVVTEMIHPALRPSATGSANGYSVAIETTNIAGEPDWKVSDDSVESIIAIGVWLVKLSRSADPYLVAPDGTRVRVDVRPDRDHIKGHKEAGVNATRCPGEFLMSKMDYIVSEVARRSAEPAPQPEPEDTVKVPRAKLQEFYDWLKGLLGK
ncbi:endolysin [Microbacterium phage Dismas]|uniref:Endolysin n=1 Tax=Microbacterium phage Dismas TaxID=2065199 RepID=A0A2H5BFQ9_9CAUD|nr:minor tail protein [Microbacterium phage Dismas]AUG84817.1 endolysin [Microbacterium phage Dismas]